MVGGSKPPSLTSTNHRYPNCHPHHPPSAPIQHIPSNTSPPSASVVRTSWSCHRFPANDRSRTEPWKVEVDQSEATKFWGKQQEKPLRKQAGNIWMFPKIVGFPPKSSIFDRVFHYKPSIWVYIWVYPPGNGYISHPKGKFSENHRLKSAIFLGGYVSSLEGKRKKHHVNKSAYTYQTIYE